MEQVGFPEETEQYKQILGYINEVKTISTEFCKTEEIGPYKKVVAPPPPPPLVPQKTSRSTPRYAFMYQKYNQDILPFKKFSFFY